MDPKCQKWLGLSISMFLCNNSACHSLCFSTNYEKIHTDITSYPKFQRIYCNILYLLLKTLDEHDVWVFFEHRKNKEVGVSSSGKHPLILFQRIRIHRTVKNIAKWSLSSQSIQELIKKWLQIGPFCGWLYSGRDAWFHQKSGSGYWRWSGMEWLWLYSRAMLKLYKSCWSWK